MQIPTHTLAFTILLGVLAALPALSIDISAPTLLQLPLSLHTTTFTAGLTLSLFMAGFALGQFGGGRISDRSGRRPVLLAGLACFTTAALACALAVSGPVLVGFRLVQGVGAGMCSVLAFAMIQDAFEGDAARSKRSYVTLILSLAPLLAPAIGSVLTGLFGWRSVHSVMALGGGLLLIVCWFAVAETIGTRTLSRPVSGAKPLARAWLERRFIGITIANALSYGCIFAYIAGSPVVIMGQMGLSPTVFASVFACTAASLSAGAWTSGMLSRRGFPAATLLRPSLIVFAAAAILVAAASLAGAAGMAFLLPPLLVVLFTRGIIGPNLQHLAIERKREQAGMASAVVGILQLSSGAIASAVVAALLPHLGSSAVSGPMAVLAFGAVLVWWWSNANRIGLDIRSERT